MSPLLSLLLVWLGVVNILAFALCGIDKRRARRHRRRVPERTLLTPAALGGAFGLWLGMAVFRHKTRKRKFTITVPLLCILWVGAVVLAALYL